MHHPRLRRVPLGVFVIVGSALCAPWSLAAFDDNKSDDSAALAGPKVVERARDNASIVEREFDGKLKRVQQHPVLLALDALELNAEQRAKVDEVIISRNAQLDGLVRDNLRLIIEAALAKQAGDQPAAQAKFGELLKIARPFLDRGPLLAELRPAMDDEHYRQLKHAVDEYNAAAAQDTANAPNAKRQNRFGAMIAQGFEGFGLEVKASYERVFADRSKEFDELLRHLDLTPEQESKVRQKVGDLVQKTYGKPTKGQLFRVFLDIYGELTPEQRKKLSQRMGEERQAERGLRVRTRRTPEPAAPAAQDAGDKPMTDPMSDAPASGS